MDTQEEIERKDFIQYFTRGTRTDGKSFYKCVEACPEELRDLIRHIHTEYFGCLPNDWIYETIRDAFNELQDCSFDSLSLEPDCYYSHLYAWFGEPYAYEYCNEVLEETGYKDIYAIISSAQYIAKERIYRAVEDFMNE